MPRIGSCYYAIILVSGGNNVVDFLSILATAIDCIDVEPEREDNLCECACILLPSDKFA